MNEGKAYLILQF